MTLLLFFLLAGLVGWTVGKLRLVALPAVLGVVYLLAVAVTGSFMQRDNPILFLLLLAMVAMAAGVLIRRRLSGS